MEITNANQIKTVYGKITVDSVTESEYKKGIFQAQLRQPITKVYPSVKIGNSNSDSLFGAESFKLADGKTYESTRVTWINVPEGETVKSVQAKIDGLKEACIYRMISNDVFDVLHDGQKQAIEAGIRSVDQFMDSLLVRDREGNELEGTPQYSQSFFKMSFTEDLDMRVSVNANQTQTASSNVQMTKA